MNSINKKQVQVPPASDLPGQKVKNTRSKSKLSNVSDVRAKKTDEADARKPDRDLDTSGSRASSSGSPSRGTYAEQVFAKSQKVQRSPVSRGKATETPKKMQKAVVSSDSESESESDDGDDVESVVEVTTGESVTDVVSEVKAIGKRLRSYLLSDNNKVLKASTEFILGCVADYEAVINRLEHKNERLAGKVEVLEKFVSTGKVGQTNVSTGCKQTNRVDTARSFASVVGPNEAAVRITEASTLRTAGGEKATGVPKNFAVVVRGEKEMDGEKVKKAVISKVAAQLKSVRVAAIRKIKDGVVIETVSETEQRLVKECAAFAKAGLRVDEPRKVGPKLLIFDVPVDMQDEELLDDLYEKNLKGQMSAEEFRSRARVVSRGDIQGKDVGNTILELGLRAKTLLLGSRKVYIGVLALKAKEIDLVLRCFRCAGIGHTSKTCKEEKVCRKCGEEGHIAKDCKSETSTCSNCKKRKLPADHSVLSDKCPVYASNVSRLKSRMS